MPAFSPIVVAGMVRAAEFTLIALIGVATYFGYVYNAYGQIFDWYYIATAFAVAGLAMIAFQAADIYQVQAFRNPVSQCARLTVAWSIVFLVVVAVAFFAQLGGMYSRLWLTSYFGIGLFALYGLRLFLYGIVRRWTREGRLDRRAVVVGGGDPGEHLVTALERQASRMCALSACSTTAATTARPPPAPACRSSARSTISSNSRAAPASTS